ncbi:MAG: molybdopterin-synthase adenylyltransferase MoeB [Candidatus Eremiobacteraeota bacterium]|nr:molybdopterin-synthase adenylyltransferase MoeB [Candidatus Eremiobacteraeota bacterium]MBC5801897.1 molybdopterin-synthase adenylyltransferase MoeB [Candidatus Eremiobacteraeota bacterium]
MVADLRRYSRHLLMPEVGLDGQRRLGRARVLVVGAGGLGSPVLQYLAAAGVGRIGIVDDDTVDVTNLQRQVIYAQPDVGRPKAATAARRVVDLNPHVAVDAYPVRLDAGNARDLVRAYDVVVDATDTFGARYLINDACRLEGKPDIYGSIFRFDGQVSVFGPDGPCYRCLFPQPPPEGTVPTCAEGGVLGVLAGLVGTWQANEALKLILGIGTALVGRLLLIDALSGRTREVGFESDPSCALHGAHATIDAVVPMPDAPTAQPPRGIVELDAAQLDAYLAEHPESYVLDVREPHESALGPAPRGVALPASVLMAHVKELDSAREYVVACRVGVKSAWALGQLEDAGFRRLKHLRGGLLAYAVARPEFEFF